MSREVGVEAHRLAAWRDEFLDAGKQGLKGKRQVSDEDRRLAEAERKIGELTMENEIWKAVARVPGEGHRKVRARLRRDQQIRVGKHRVLRLMRREGLLAPQRA